MLLIRNQSGKMPDTGAGIHQRPVPQIQKGQGETGRMVKSAEVGTERGGIEMDIDRTCDGSCETCHYARPIDNDFHDAICECVDSVVYADFVDNDCVCDEYVRRES